MIRPLIYFDGTNVMLIREQDVPTLEGLKQQMCGVGPEGWCDRDGCCKGYCVAANCSIGSMADRAKKKAIRVENLTAEGLHHNGQITPYVYSEHPTPLAESYTYEVTLGPSMDHGEIVTCDLVEKAIIKRT